jgi:mannose-6-phosphate isomerase-like protein (cupin superfamily)
MNPISSSPFSDRLLPEASDVIAPDGSEVRLLASNHAGSMAHFRLLPGQISQAVAHRSVEELWYVVSGTGAIWRKRGDEEMVLPLAAGQSLSIPVGAQFQFRCDGGEPLNIVGVTMPPWPGMDEAYAVEGKW